MKNLLMSTVVLIAFSLAIIIFQMSCKKEVNAQSSPNYTLPIATTSTLGGVIVGSGLSVSNSGVVSVNNSSSTTQVGKVIFKKISKAGSEIWLCNYDGTSPSKVNITLPAGYNFADDMTPMLSPDGKKIFFTAGFLGNSVIKSDVMFVCNTDGTSVAKILEAGAGITMQIGGAY
jgi:hypothetical protein